MNQIYLGQRAYGFASASEVYFGKPLKDITIAEAAMLAGLPKAPSAYNPIANPRRATVRQLHIIERMLEAVKADILIRGDNDYLQVKKTECREIIVSRCWDALVKAIGQLKALELAKMGKGDFEDAFKATLPKDKSGRMARGGGQVIKRDM